MTSQVASSCVFVVLALVSTSCRQEKAPPKASQHTRAPDAPSHATATATTEAPATTGSPSAAPIIEPTGTGRPYAPPLPSGRLLAWQIEQEGRVVRPEKHVVDLLRKPFTLALHMRCEPRASVLVSASFGSTTLDGARLGWPFKALEGFHGSSRMDSGYAHILNNSRRDILVGTETPNEWLACAPGSAACDGFDAPCDRTDSGLLCRRTIDSLHTIISVESKGTWTMKDVRTDIASSPHDKLYLVFVLPGHWTEDELSGKAPLSPEAAREWAIVEWIDQR